MRIPTVSFDVDADASELCAKIGTRASEMAREHKIRYPRRDAIMDITATHANGCPMQLVELLNADDANFAHDVFGIRRHLNRETGALENCFLPRFNALA